MARSARWRGLLGRGRSADTGIGGVPHDSPSGSQPPKRKLKRLSNEIVHTAIIDGDPLFREGLRRILEDTRYRVDVLAPSIGQMMRHREQLDLLLLLGFSNGDPEFLDALAELRARWPNARVVAIAENRADELIAALKAGVHGYLARYISAEALLRFLRLIVLGQRVFSTRSLDLPRHLDQRTARHAAQGLRAGGIDSSALTERERELLAFLVEGQSNKVIARELGIAEATVKAQMVKLFVKIGATNRTQAAVLAWTLHRASPLKSSRLPDRGHMNRVS
jgi:two-component system, NarL family, nitrate/nitrite response regulator NarL